MSDSLFIYKYKYKYRYIRAFICLYSRIPQLAKMEGQTITTVHAACHCGKNSFTLHYPSASLPVSSGICHCDSTRHATGMLFGTFVPIPDGTSLIADVNSPPPSVREYRSSTIGSRYFCATCGAKLAFYHRGFDKWLIAIGLLERVDGIVKIERHQWVGDTGDGSILQVMKDDLPRYSQGPNSGKFVLVESPPANSAVKTESLRAKCHCGGFQANIIRPSAAQIENEEARAQCLASSGNRWRAGHCLDKSCRTTSGLSLTSWCWFPKSHVEITHSSTLVDYRSSEGKTRQFCGGCGATVSIAREDWPWRCQIAMGLLEFPKEVGFWSVVLDWFEFMANGKPFFASEAVDSWLRDSLTA
jgi:hypothetical protein